uniref:Hemocyanin type 1 n=1 Tax=Haliotis rubra TaxID=36100 RepID=A0A2Z1Q3B0_9VEST|nr:hemocyanin type 1 [Haliotis rubra]
MWLVHFLLVALTTGAGADNVVRKDVSHLTDDEVQALHGALHDLTEATGPMSVREITTYHAAPASCEYKGRKIACCVHGMPSFPFWHRAYVVQAERALLSQRKTVGMPYWDWTQTLTHLPSIVTEPIYIDSKGGKAQTNYWYRGEIAFINKKTARAVDDRLFEKVEPGHYTHLMETVLDALEQDEFCKFEIQFELAHNAIHYLVGGNFEYSMSNLEYTSYDPIFFLHHSNVDRIFAIWQRLQELRGKNPNAMDCAHDLSRQQLQPFNRDSNPVQLTKDHSRPVDLFDYKQLGYSYDSLYLNGMSPEKLKSELDERHSKERAFASFRLSGFGGSANVVVYACIPGDDPRSDDYCEKAGDFFILGGASEMPWKFYRPFFFDVTDAVHRLGVPLSGHYYVKANPFSVNGTSLSPDLVPQPTVAYRPGKGHLDPPVHHRHDDDLIVRKNIDHLTREEEYALRRALERFQADTSVDGYQATVEYHGLPARCPQPDAKVRFACCMHGMASFPHWHRLFVTQVEDALVRRGSPIGVPYWDWTKPMTHLPELASDATYIDPHGHIHHNPFYNANISFAEGHHHTSRSIDSRLFAPAAYGDHTHLFDGILYAFEQEDFCDFEIQFELVHNSIHAWIGGSEDYSMATLHYTAFDPIFYLHHSNVDRLWAIWQALQIRRHKPYQAHCAQSVEQTPMKPFAFSSPLNNNEKTHSHSIPTDIYDYEEELHYSYDDLTFGGMNLDEIEEAIHLRQQHERVFAGFFLGGIGKSALVDIFIKKTGSEPHKAGDFAILGGAKEMPWAFDRVYKVEITDALKILSLEVDGDYEVTFTIHDMHGNELDTDLIPHAAVISEPAHPSFEDEAHSLRIRKNVDSLTPEETNELRKALDLLQKDHSAGGFNQLGAFHGEPKWCPNPEAEHKVACCVHGMAVFPHWHRLLALQAENALRKHGYSGALPYWDWTRPVSKLPDLVAHEHFTDPSDHHEKHNPWFNGHIDTVNHNTTRSVRSDLYQQPEFGHFTDIAQQVLLALEQDDFCSFEVQYEISHNFIHALVGGTDPYGMASLRYTAYDPLFFLHHSNTDRIWAIWQSLQKYRGKPYNTANCAIASMRRPLEPFGLSSDINPDIITREHAIPFDVFNYKDNFHYVYDTLEFNGLSISQLNRELDKIKSHERVFAGFLLSGIKKSALVKFEVCTPPDHCHKAGEFYLLGDENEMAWAYDQLFKYDITHVLEENHLHFYDNIFIHYEVFDLKGTSLGTDLFHTANVIHDKGTGTREHHTYVEEVTGASHIRKNLNDLNTGEMESLRAAFLHIQNDGTYESIAQYHGKPGKCELNHRSIACCVHGMPTFPQWHRLYVAQVENALLKRGSGVAVPYWEWTSPIDHLPHFIDDATYFNSRQQRYDPNPFFRGRITFENAVTTRDPQEGLFNSDYMYENVLLALEQENYCDFEIQFELVHNALHSMLGGKGQYSMSSLDYSAFDPVFFLHHANTDRLWAIWQELQRYRDLPYEEANCAINLMHQPLKPFSDPHENHDNITLKYSKPQDGFDYQNHFGYKYDNLEFHHLSIPSLDVTLKQRKHHDRVFAGFLLHNIGTSADITIYICLPDGRRGHDCSHEAGTFYLLGGETEMPFIFDRLYKFEITKPLQKLGVKLHGGVFELELEIRAYNGSYLDSHTFDPTIIFEPGTDTHILDHDHKEEILVRKNINDLSPRERVSLVRALEGMKNDRSSDGYQAIASFHALPPLCPNPAAAHRYACCVHGMATFPQWHRLYTVQFQDALRRHGSFVGVPYWDWTKPATELPKLLSSQTFHDPIHNINISNPFFQADIEFEGAGVHTERHIDADLLFHSGDHDGYHNWFFETVLFALEQEDYCNFEIQFEIAHNGIHTWIGGNAVYGMGHLHYASYDPIFYIHHSQTDRIWAIWQELQKYRGLSGSEANCAIDHMRTPLKPFSFGPPYNLNHHTQEFSKPEDTFDYKKFGYRYDNLELEGRSIAHLDELIKERQEQDRTFAGFLLKGFGTSATVSFEICRVDHTCEKAGYFTVLGGSAEMPWVFDRLYKYDITKTLHDMHLRHEDTFSVKVTVTSYNGTVLSGDLIQTPSIIFVPGRHKLNSRKHAPNKIRHELSSLSSRDIASLKAALTSLQHDSGTDGYQATAAFHGVPAQCHDASGREIACCIHGMATFPHWHRLYTLQLEQALSRHGSSVAVPYWDWTKPITELPHLLTDGEYYDVWQNAVITNPFARGYVKFKDAFTVRNVQEGLFKMSTFGKHSLLFDQALLALEQTDYCDFEVQFEVMHNTIHYLVGGRQTYAFSSLEYSSYDPIFFIHHSFVDKIWAVWQELQSRRHLQYKAADCAVGLMSKAMRPFNKDFNHNSFTKKHAVPNTVFDYEDLGYNYDNLELSGLNLNEIEALISKRKSHARVFAGFLLFGLGTSADIHLDICKTSENCHHAGVIFILGGSAEMHWAYNRLYKYDITEALHEFDINPEDVFHADEPFFLKLSVVAVNGTVIPSSLLHQPTIIYEPGEGHHDDHESGSIAGSGVRKDVNTLTKAETDNLREALKGVMDDHGPNGFQAIAAFHGKPALCPMPDGHNYSCCTHGMATFPHWHRLYTKQMEDALKSHGSLVGLPYWDWTTAFTHLPTLVIDTKNNPFNHGHIEYLDVDTTRSPRDMLFNDPEHGSESFFYRQVLLALEQTDFCQFEVQYEITHNAIHSWTGGHSPYGMSTLDFTAYDPLFWLHHSNTDRIWAIWQALQEYRGLPYNHANCEIQAMKTPLRPFSDEINHNPVTKANSKPVDVFEYNRLSFQYDNLIFHGYNIPDLDHMLEERKQEDRIFAAFLLSGIKHSADVVFDICQPGHECVFAGTFAILGGELEMPWSFDRLFRYDITKVMKQLHLRHDSDFTFRVKIVGIDDHELPSDSFKAPTIEFEPGVHDGGKHDDGHHDDRHSDVLIRKEVDFLSLQEANAIKDALYKLQNDNGKGGFEAIAGYHGYPNMCPEHGTDKYPCCVHGMPVFPHWHRLHTIQMERALKNHGSPMGIPYWDWTKKMSSLPAFFTDAGNGNPFYKYYIRGVQHETTREINPIIFNQTKFGEYDYLYYLSLQVLEENSYCDFEVQYEILHNAIHAWLGGPGMYSMSTLEYSAFDPVFMIHHSSLDRIWILWQKLQKRRMKPYYAIDCAGDRLMKAPLHPFNYETVNEDEFTRTNSYPNIVFDHYRFNYEYDNLRVRGHDIHELEEVLKELRNKDRIFAGFVLSGLQISAPVKVYIHSKNETIHEEYAGEFAVLGGEKEMPWAYERMLKLDITDAVNKLHLKDEDIRFRMDVTAYNGDIVTTQLSQPFIVHRPAHVSHDILVIPVGAGHALPPKVVVKGGTKIEFTPIDSSVDRSMVELGSFTALAKCIVPPFTYHGFELNKVYSVHHGDYYITAGTKELCKQNLRLNIHVEHE